MAALTSESLNGQQSASSGLVEVVQITLLNKTLTLTSRRPCRQNKEKKKKKEALAGVAQWSEHQPANQKVIGSIPSQGTCLGYGPGPQ